MKPTPDPIAKQIKALQKEIGRLELPAREARLHAANAARDKFQQDNAHSLHTIQTQNAMQPMARECSEARESLDDGQRTAAYLQRDIERLETLATADDRAVTADTAVSAVTATVLAAQAAVGAAQATLLEIDALVLAEQGVYDLAKKKAGAAMLDDIRAGKKPKTSPVSHDVLDTLAAAQTAVLAEMATTQQALVQCTDQLRDAEDTRAHARTDVAACALHLLSLEYAAALFAYRMACSVARRTPDEPDLDLMVAQMCPAEPAEDDPEPEDEPAEVATTENVVMVQTARSPSVTRQIRRR